MTPEAMEKFCDEFTLVQRLRKAFVEGATTGEGGLKVNDAKALAEEKYPFPELESRGEEKIS